MSFLKKMYSTTGMAIFETAMITTVLVPVILAIAAYSEYLSLTNSLDHFAKNYLKETNYSSLGINNGRMDSWVRNDLASSEEIVDKHFNKIAKEAATLLRKNGFQASDFLIETGLAIFYIDRRSGAMIPRRRPGSNGPATLNFLVRTRGNLSSGKGQNSILRKEIKSLSDRYEASGATFPYAIPTSTRAVPLQMNYGRSHNYWEMGPGRFHLYANYLRMATVLSVAISVDLSKTAPGKLVNFIRKLQGQKNTSMIHSIHYFSTPGLDS